MSEQECEHKTIPEQECVHIKIRKVRRYILIALGATLAASAIIILVSFIFRPPRITFTITKTSQNDSILFLTIAANNTSHHRAAVKFYSVSVDLDNSTMDPDAWTRLGNVDMPLPTRYLTNETSSIDASFYLMGSKFGDNETIGDGGGHGVTVLVRALVRFKIGPARTRMYKMAVCCRDVFFPAKPVLSAITCT